MASKDVHYKPPVVIRKIKGFDELYADSGIPVPEAPKATTRKKFTEASAEMSDAELRAVREYDRARSGGIVHA